LPEHPHCAIQARFTFSCGWKKFAVYLRISQMIGSQTIGKGMIERYPPSILQLALSVVHPRVHPRAVVAHPRLIE